MVICQAFLLKFKNLPITYPIWATSISLFTFMHWRRKWQPTPVFLPGKSHGQRSPAGHNPWGPKRVEHDLATQQQQQEHQTWSQTGPHIRIIQEIGEGNGNPLQCSSLENPRDMGAWWAAVYGVSQSWTRLKRFSSRRLLIIPTLRPYPTPESEWLGVGVRH